MNIDAKQIIEYWEHHSAYDLETAGSLFNSGRYPYCLFMSHQAIEKLLKAQIVKITKDHAPYGHNLLRLAELGDLPFSREQMERLAEITEFNLKARYDDYLSKFHKKCTKEYTEKYFIIAKELYLWIRDQLEKN